MTMGTDYTRVSTLGSLGDEVIKLQNTYLPDPYGGLQGYQRTKCNGWGGCGCGGWDSNKLGQLLIAGNSYTEVLPKFELKDDKYTFSTILAGYDKANVSLVVSENVLSVKATKGGLEGKDSYDKKISIPAKADIAGVKVSLEAGILKITLPSITPPILTIQIP